MEHAEFGPERMEEMLHQRHTEITHDSLLTVHRETLTQYITFKRGGRGQSVLLYFVRLATVNPASTPQFG
jgi:hypothetical protein